LRIFRSFRFIRGNIFEIYGIVLIYLLFVLVLSI